MRKEPLVTNEYYHVFNRGVDKRNIFLDKHDLSRLLLYLRELNTIDPIGRLFEYSPVQVKNRRSKKWLPIAERNISPLVEIVSYCLNPNHYHFILKQIEDSGISEFMHRINGGYTRYFNNKLKRTGSLFENTFKSVHVKDNNQLLYLSAYVNLNFKIHALATKNISRKDGQRPEELSASSFDILDKDNSVVSRENLILSQFKTISEYKKYALDLLPTLVTAKKAQKETDKFELE